MTIKITKYRRIGGGNTITHSPIEISNLSEGQRAGPLKLVKGREMEHKQIDSQDVIQFIRVLAELNMCGLTSEQEQHLLESADIDKAQLEEVLGKADEAYDILKDLLGQGYQIYRQPLTEKEVFNIQDDKKESIKAIVFATASDLNINDYTDELYQVIDDLLFNSSGEDNQLTYQALFSSVPFSVEGVVLVNDDEDSD